MTEIPADIDLTEKFPADVEWRKTLPLEFQPVAARWGRELFAIAYNIGAIGEGVQMLASKTQQGSQAMHILNSLANGANQLITMLLEAKEIKQDLIHEIQKDCDIASKLLGASRTKPGSSIILPDH